MKYPEVVTNPHDGRPYEATEPFELDGGWRINYYGFGRWWGRLDLPEGWQDMDRTWTPQDIDWATKYDCRPVREGVPLRGLRERWEAIMSGTYRETTLHSELDFLKDAKPNQP